MNFSSINQDTSLLEIHYFIQKIFYPWELLKAHQGLLK